MYGPSAEAKRQATEKTSKTRVFEVFLAGDVEHAKQVIRRFCKDHPCCVTVTPTTYIYRGGEEAGFVVGVRNYPRFDADASSLQNNACDIGLALRDALAQDSYMVVDHDGLTTWSSTRQGG